MPFFTWLEANWRNFFAAGHASYAIATAAREGRDRRARRARDRRPGAAQPRPHVRACPGSRGRSSPIASSRRSHRNRHDAGVRLFGPARPCCAVEADRVRRHLAAVGLPTQISADSRPNAGCRRLPGPDVPGQEGQARRSSPLFWRADRREFCCAGDSTRPEGPRLSDPDIRGEMTAARVRAPPGRENATGGKPWRQQLPGSPRPSAAENRLQLISRRNRGRGVDLSRRPLRGSTSPKLDRRSRTGCDISSQPRQGQRPRDLPSDALRNGCAGRPLPRRRRPP